MVLKGEEPSAHEPHLKMTGQMWPEDLHGKEEKRDPETPESSPCFRRTEKPAGIF